MTFGAVDRTKMVSRLKSSSTATCVVEVTQSGAF